MKIIRDKKYIKKIQHIVEYIAKDSLSQALKFHIKLDEAIDGLVDMPYKFRKSIYFENQNIRDLVFKEYVIPYKIDTTKNQITIIGINKYQKKI